MGARYRLSPELPNVTLKESLRRGIAKAISGAVNMWARRPSRSMHMQLSDLGRLPAVVGWASCGWRSIG